MSTFEEAKALLEKEGTATGASVFDHLSGVILKILNESPDDPVATFEALSMSVKQSSYLQKSGEGAQLSLSDDAKAAQIAAANATLAKLAVGEDGPTEGAEVQDLLGDSNLLEWAGVVLGQAEAYQLQCFMKTIVTKEGAPEDESDPVTITNIRFWGKILGAKGVDYYIYECQCDGRNIEVSVDRFILFIFSLFPQQFITCFFPFFHRRQSNCADTFFSYPFLFYLFCYFSSLFLCETTTTTTDSRGHAHGGF